MLKVAGVYSSEGHCGRGRARVANRKQIVKGLWVMRRLCHKVKVLVWDDVIRMCFRSTRTFSLVSSMNDGLEGSGMEAGRSV